jgi:TetR/AcrR family transcriptional regulator, repressor for divergent bdcA
MAGPARLFPCVKTMASACEICERGPMTGASSREDMRRRGRPRQFDVDEATRRASTLFEARGYDRVSLVDLTAAMGINPPSFYAAFGSKAVLFARILEEYGQQWTGELRACFAQGAMVDAALRVILLRAAERFAPTEDRRGGCLILEAGQNCSDALVAGIIRKARLQVASTLYRGISQSQPERAAVLTDYMLGQLSGLSALAREGTDTARLSLVAKMAGAAISAPSA